jgi:hypothetical protein
MTEADAAQAERAAVPAESPPLSCASMTVWGRDACDPASGEMNPEAAMDMSSLVAVHLPREHPSTRMRSSEEDRYYRDQLMTWRPRFRALGSIALRVRMMLRVLGRGHEARSCPADQRAILYEPLQRGTVRWTSARLRGRLFWR